MVRRTLLKSLIACALAGFVTVAASAQTAPAAGSAGATYLAYLAAMKTAKKPDDVMKYWSADGIAEFKKMGGDAKTFDMIKGFVTMYSNVKVVKETPNAKGATLNVEGVDMDKKKATGTVDMLKEGGAWKVGKESWKS